MIHELMPNSLYFDIDITSILLGTKINFYCKGRQNSIGLIWDFPMYLYSIYPKMAIIPNQSNHFFVAIEEPYEAEVSRTVLK